MTTERRGLFVMRTDETGTKCDVGCPHYELHLDEDGEPCVATCDAFANHEVEWDDDGHSVRLAACIAAEQAAREAEVAAVRRGFVIAERGARSEVTDRCGATRIDWSDARDSLVDELDLIRGGKSP